MINIIHEIVKNKLRLYFVTALALVLAVTGGWFAYAYATVTVELDVVDKGPFVVTANTTPTPWNIWRGYKGKTGATDLFTITPGTNFTGDFSAVITLANGHDLVEAYRVLVLEIEIEDNTSTTIVGPEYLTLSGGEIDMDITNTNPPFTVKLTEGFYITHRSAWASGKEDPLILLDVFQRGTATP